MNKVKTIGQWKYFIIAYLITISTLMIYFLILDNVSIFLIWGVILTFLISVVLVARNPIIKIEDQSIRLIYPFREKTILRKNIHKINSIPFLHAYVLVTKNEEFFLILNPFRVYMNFLFSTHSYSEKVTSILKGDENS